MEIFMLINSFLAFFICFRCTFVCFIAKNTLGKRHGFIVWIIIIVHSFAQAHELHSIDNPWRAEQSAELCEESCDSIITSVDWRDMCKRNLNLFIASRALRIHRHMILILTFWHLYLPIENRVVWIKLRLTKMRQTLENERKEKLYHVPLLDVGRWRNLFRSFRDAVVRQHSKINSLSRFSRQSIARF